MSSFKFDETGIYLTGALKEKWKKTLIKITHTVQKSLIGVDLKVNPKPIQPPACAKDLDPTYGHMYLINL